MDNYNHISLQGGGQDSEANAEEEGEDGVKKDDTNSNGAGAIDHLAKLPGTKAKSLTQKKQNLAIKHYFFRYSRCVVRQNNNNSNNINFSSCVKFLLLHSFIHSHINSNQALALRRHSDRLHFLDTVTLSTHVIGPSVSIYQIIVALLPRMK